jgi:DNA repair exonuclease SbcCD ATPase subunit
MLSISYDEDIESFNDKLLNERNKLIEEKMDLITSIKKFNMVDNSTLIDDYEEKIQKLEVGQIRSIEAVIKEKENFIRKIANDIYNLRKDISRYEKDISFYETNDSCSICKQDITLNFRKNKIKEIKKEIKKLKEEEYALADQEKRYSREIGNYSTGLEESKRLQKSYILQQGELKREQSININSKKHLTAALENINIKITELESGDNPFIEKENKRKKMLSILNRKKEHLEAEIEELTESKNGYDFWSVGFKKIKLLVIEEALVELEMSINNAISDLGMSNWAIRLSIESNTKKDTIKSGFTVMVKSPHNKDLVPFTAWSGGESQRLRLAGQIGIIDFISNYKGIDASFEAWDEPSAWLSSEGIDSLISLLNNRAKDLNKVIYFIDHKQLSVDGNFADIINIKKTKGGTICE